VETTMRMETSETFSMAAVYAFSPLVS